MRVMNSALRHLMLPAPVAKQTHIITNSDFDRFIGRERTNEPVMMRDAKTYTPNYEPQVQNNYKGISLQQKIRSINVLDTQTSKITFNRVLRE